MENTILRFPRRRISRRGFVSVGAAASAVVAGIPVGMQGALAAADPVFALGLRRRELYAEADAIVRQEEALFARGAPQAEQDRHNEAVREAWWRVREIEKRMIPLVATSAAGIAEQVEVFRGARTDDRQHYRRPTEDPAMNAPDVFALGGRVDPVLTLAAERQRLMQESFRVRDAADAILHTLPVEVRAMPKAQVGRHGGHQREPIFAYSEAEIASVFERTRCAFAAMWGEQHTCIGRLGAEERQALIEFRANVGEQRRAYDACGYGALDREADDLTERWFEVERRLLATTATSIAGVIAQLSILRERAQRSDGDAFELVIAALRGLEAPAAT